MKLSEFLGQIAASGAAAGAAAANYSRERLRELYYQRDGTWHPVTERFQIPGLPQPIDAPAHSLVRPGGIGLSELEFSFETDITLGAPDECGSSVGRVLLGCVEHDADLVEADAQVLEVQSSEVSDSIVIEGLVLVDPQPGDELLPDVQIVMPAGWALRDMWVGDESILRRWRFRPQANAWVIARQLLVEMTDGAAAETGLRLLAYGGPGSMLASLLDVDGEVREVRADRITVALRTNDSVPTTRARVTAKFVTRDAPEGIELLLDSCNAAMSRQLNVEQ